MVKSCSQTLPSGFENFKKFWHISEKIVVPLSNPVQMSVVQTTGKCTSSSKNVKNGINTDLEMLYLVEWRHTTMCHAHFKECHKENKK